MDSLGLYSAGCGFCVGLTCGVIFLTKKEYKKAGLAATVAVLSLIFMVVNIKAF
jgi:hypothetical protein